MANALSSSDTETAEGCNQFFFNIVNNSGTVVIGEVVNMVSPAFPSSNETARAVDENVRGFECPDQSNATRQGINYDTPCSSGRRFPLDERSVIASAQNQQFRCHECKRVKTKEHFNRLEASEYRRKKRSDRKRLKRQQRHDPRCTSQSSCDDTRDATLKELALEGDGCSFQQALQIFYYCVATLHPLRDNGCWDEFERAAEKLLDEAAGDVTRKIIICLERSAALSYQKEFERSEEMIHSAVSKISQTNGSVRLLLEVLSNCYLSTLYRRRRMLGKVEGCLKIAKKISSGFPPCLAVAFLLYEEGSCQRDFASILTGSRKEPAIAQAKEKAKELMQRCIDLCCRLDDEKVYVRKQHFAVCKMAMMNLHCETSASRSESITPKSIQEAKKLLETLQTDYYIKREVKGARIQRLIANVDIDYRLGNYNEAEKCAKEALEITKTLQFNLDIIPLEERLQDIHQKTTAASSSETFRYIPVIIDSSSSKNDSPNSSEYEDKL